jgi:hypothetical protein
MKISEIEHPEYTALKRSWPKWRLTYNGGDDFINAYVQTFSQLEDNKDYVARKLITYVPAFAKAAVNDIKNAIFQRTEDITRKGGPESYQNAILGINGGVDLNGSSMNAFIGREVLPELLTMKKVGVYIDAPQDVTGTRYDAKNLRPYIYLYKAEQIKSWTLAPGDNGTEYTTLLLEDYYEDIDEETGLTIGTLSRFRLLKKVDNHVEVTFYDVDGIQIDKDGNPSEITYTIEISHIPFVVFELTDSLLKDIANHQIALTNLASSDINYALKCNIPFYTEQYDPRAQNIFQRPPSAGQASVSVDETVTNYAGTAVNAQQAKQLGIKIGATSGRRYPIGAERPAFVSPPPENLEVSMEKQEQLKKEIRQLVALALSNIEPKSASAESKKMDMTGLEAGLSYIGLELENGERKIAVYWSAYDGAKETATVRYPSRYSLQTDAERRTEANELKKLAPSVPSVSFQREITKQIAQITIGHKVTNEKLNEIYKEIDSANVLNTDPDIIIRDVEAGILDKRTAAISKGYPESTVEKAEKEHAARLARIAEAQGENIGTGASARGIKDADGDSTASKMEKEDKAQRGDGKKINKETKND